jgi:poly(3-hydroxybutyrate) depolymerase
MISWNSSRRIAMLASRVYAALFAAMLITPGALRADDVPLEKKNEKAGAQTLRFFERSELSAKKTLVARMGWLVSPEEAAKDYNLAEESFELYVPDAYTGEKPFGLFVFVNPGGNGHLMNQWKSIIDRHELIWIGPNNAGNDRQTPVRMGLSIDATYNMQKQYKIDPSRVYICGVSGGGRVASMLGVSFADVFKGGFYIIGCNFYRPVVIDEKTKTGYARSYKAPPATIFKAARTQTKHIFLTGDTDGNREQTQLYYNAFKHDGFDHITYLQVPGMGHQPPDEEWFAKGMAALDEPLAVATPPKPSAATQRSTTRPTAASVAAAKVPASEPSDPATIAAHLLTGAKLYIDNKQYERGREKLKWIIQQYPKTPAATEAQKMLTELKDK